jgi:hypothetical protein
MLRISFAYLSICMLRLYNYNYIWITMTFAHSVNRDLAMDIMQFENSYTNTRHIPQVLNPEEGILKPGIQYPPKSAARWGQSRL